MRIEADGEILGEPCSITVALEGRDGMADVSVLLRGDRVAREFTARAPVNKETERALFAALFELGSVLAGEIADHIADERLHMVRPPRIVIRPPWA